MENYLTREDFGKVILIDVEPGIQLIKHMVRNQVEEAVREVQCNEVKLSDNLKDNDYIDVRLSLPNGKDYVVLSKKAIHGLLEEEGKRRCYLWLNDEEISQYTMAVVEMSLNRGANLYSTKYLQATIQKETKITYQPDLERLNNLTLKDLKKIADFNQIIYESWEESSE